MQLINQEISVTTEEGKVSYVDITTEVEEVIEKSNITNGICVVITPHTTCSIFFEEYSHDFNEEGNEYLQQDLDEALEKIIPPHTSQKTYNYPGEKHYEEVESWENAEEYLPDGDRSALWNGDAHLKSTLIGSSETFTVEKSRLGVGTTGYIYIADFDQTRPRTRKCKIVVIGE